MAPGLAQHPPLKALKTNYKCNRQNLLSKPHVRVEMTEQKQSAQGHTGLLQHSWDKWPELQCPNHGPHLPVFALLL